MFIHDQENHPLLPYGDDERPILNCELVPAYYRMKKLLKIIMELRRSRGQYVPISLQLLKRMMVQTFTGRNVVAGDPTMFNEIMRKLMAGGYVLLNDNGIVLIKKNRINKWYNGHYWEGAIRF